MDWQEVWDKFTDGLNGAMESINRALMSIFGNSNEREVAKLRPRVGLINELEPKMQALSNAELKEVTQRLRKRIIDGAKLDDILVEAFAACRESGRRFLNMRHYDVQLLGGMVLHQGRIAEMVTGEGKTLVATLPAYLNALEGLGVHVVTVNDYLARRDAEWMNPLYTGLGLTVGAIQSNMESHERQHHYRCDITYGTNNEFGFDYLRDNMKPTRDLQCQGPLNYAIIDEVDSILIDEARTPLIISGSAFDDPGKYRRANQVALQLKKDVHFEVKEKEHTCHLTDAGILEAERIVGVESFYTPGNMEWPHMIDNALKANYLYRRDKDYMVRNGEVIIIDEHTGRPMEGRQWSDGLHQAVEAKENVHIKEETQTLATITFQNFFKLYKKISGMTGTAMTEAHEFYKIYKLDVVAIPTNKPLRRENYPDVIFCTKPEKWHAVLDEVKCVHKTGRPILVGTTSVENSEKLSEMFKRNGIKHEVLNAKFIEREAEIIAQAGRKGAITISTNMAGRGTDIILGGNPEAQAWAELKSQYASRLDIPPEVWRQTIQPYEVPMRAEGREVAEPRPTIELAKFVNTSDPAALANIVDNATPRERDNPEALAEKHNVEAKPLAELCALYKAARPGGLHIVGTERHEARRIDNQLRGRAGRQGDPGSSRFFLALEDDLMRIFAGDWVRSLLQRMGMVEGEAIESRMVSRRIEAAQKRVEERNFEIRKNLLEYDEIMDTQRKRVYGFRQNILDGAECKALVLEMIDKQIARNVDNYLEPAYGPKCFAAYAAKRLGVEFESAGKEFLRCSFEQAEQIARDEALRQAESAIIDKIDEDLSEDVEPKEWNWEALANWANTRWGLKYKSYDLKRLTRNKISVEIYNDVKKVIDQVSLEGGRECFDADFQQRSLVEWVNQKFAMNIKIEDLGGLEQEKSQIIKFLERKSRETYEEKEVLFPVHCGLTRFMADKASDLGSRYDREGLIEWARHRFDVDWNIEDFRNMPRAQVLQKLTDASREFFQGGRYREEIQAQLDKAFPNGADHMPVEKLTELSEWTEMHLDLPLAFERSSVDREEVRRKLSALAERRFRPEIHEVERVLLLQFLDTGWKDHLYSMDHLRSGIGLVGYAQVDPKVEYKRKGKQLFEEMWDSVERKVTDLIFRIEEVNPDFVTSVFHVTNAAHAMYQMPAEQRSYSTDGQGGIAEEQEAAIEASKGEKVTEPIRNRQKKVGRNDPCPCGSGKKYKNCCLKKGGRMPV